VPAPIRTARDQREHLDVDALVCRVGAARPLQIAARGDLPLAAEPLVERSGLLGIVHSEPKSHDFDHIEAWRTCHYL
jgi:hypothetical protein